MLSSTALLRDGQCGASAGPKEICSYGQSCYRRNPHHFLQYAHPALEEAVRELGDKPEIPDAVSQVFQISKSVLKEQIDILKKLQLPSNTQATTETATEPPAPVEKPAPVVSLNSGGSDYKERMLERTKKNIKDKLELSAPYNVFMNSIHVNDISIEEDLSLSFFELLDPSLGELESSLQINFMVEFGWLMAQYAIMGAIKKPMTLLYNHLDIEDIHRYTHITPVYVKPPNAFGSHHTKMMIMSYKDGSIRVIVTTANLIESDWEMRNQGIWISPNCPPGHSEDNETHFKRDLLAYLRAYDLKELQPWQDKVENANFSHVKVFFVGHVPGTHRIANTAQLWGQSALKSILQKYLPKGAPPTEDNPGAPVNDKNRSLIIQCSSIGSLGPKPDSWLMSDIASSMCPYGERPTVNVIYPTHENVESGICHILEGGGCLPYSVGTHSKQIWLEQYLCQWKSDARSRSGAMPHIKTYGLVSKNLDKLYFFALTSANLSKAAWGTKSASNHLRILSYEAGVVFIPQVMIGSDFFPLKYFFEEEPREDKREFPMPFDLPVTKYTKNDIPWFIENLH